MTVSFLYDLDGISLIIDAEVDLGELPSYRGRREHWTPGTQRSVTSVTVYHVVKCWGKKQKEVMPQLFVDQMREVWSIDDLIWDAVADKIRQDEIDHAVDVLEMLV